MLTNLLQKTQLSHLKSLVSPAFFDVVPTRMLWSQGKSLVANYRNDEGFADAVEERRIALADAALPVRLTSNRTSAVQVPSDPDRYAEEVVTLYFHQLWFGRMTILDLRPSALSEDRDGAGRLLWHPAPMWTGWNTDFRQHLQAIYAGFYTDDLGRFEGGLDALGLSSAAELFRRHFGEDLEATRFELQGFIDTFHAIFVHCRDHDIALPGDFVTLGIYLATMYENLDRLDVTVNVRRCFERATTTR